MTLSVTTLFELADAFDARAVQAGLDGITWDVTWIEAARVLRGVALVTLLCDYARRASWGPFGRPRFVAIDA